MFDELGIPYVKTNDLVHINVPMMVAFYALAYAGYEDYYHTNLTQNDKKLRHCADWLVENLLQSKTQHWGWAYNCDYKYNNIFVKKPWYIVN